MARWLVSIALVADPPEVTAGGLAERLQASRGSISAAARTLVQMGFTERVRPPGERKDHFRIKPDAWHELTRRQLDAVTRFRKVGERGVDLTQHQGLSERTRRNFRDFLRLLGAGVARRAGAVGEGAGLRWRG